MLEGQIQALQNQITEHTSRDLSATETKLTALQLSHSTIEGQITQITTRTQRNQEALTQLSRFRKELPAIEERWIQVKTLADTTGGTLSGKEKIMLETYVQMTYFDRILVRANSRLLVMSRGQYELQRCISSGSNRRQTGLELDVIDHFNGTTRSVKTLSGGESFQAALSLALGLSDEVQSLAGRIHLDNSRQGAIFPGADFERGERTQLWRRCVAVWCVPSVTGAISCIEKCAAAQLRPTWQPLRSAISS